MSPLDPQLKQLLRRHRSAEPPPIPPSQAFINRALAARRRHPPLPFLLPERFLAGTVLASCALIIAGGALLYQVARSDAISPSLISASQFAASRFLR